MYRYRSWLAKFSELATGIGRLRIKCLHGWNFCVTSSQRAIQPMSAVLQTESIQPGLGLPQHLNWRQFRVLDKAAQDTLNALAGRCSVQGTVIENRNAWRTADWFNVRYPDQTDAPVSG
jgi:hypothetical protein